MAHQTNWEVGSAMPRGLRADRRTICKWNTLNLIDNMRLPPLSPKNLSPELRFVHEEIANLVARSQGQVSAEQAL